MQPIGVVSIDLNHQISAFLWGTRSNRRSDIVPDHTNNTASPIEKTIKEKEGASSFLSQVTLKV
jgi:hypothetical protein